MDTPWTRGRVARQAHVGVPEGTHEEEFARSGFFGRYAHLYREHPPVDWTRIEGPLRPHAYDLRRLEARAGGDWIAARVELFANEDCRVSMAALDAPMPYCARNADADEVLFVHEGEGRLESDFGALDWAPGHYLVIPRGTTYRLAPTSPARVLVTETRAEVGVPDRGMLGQHALFDPAVLRVPSPEPSTLAPVRGPEGADEWEVRVLRLGEVTRIFYPYCPLDVVGWKGTLSVLGLDVRDIRPVLSDRYHLPPSAHTTFLAEGGVFCTFLPRPLENGDPEAVKVPFYHSNIDFDEVIFYHAGDFFSREGIAPGSLTLHPQGIHHGPQPRAKERARGATRTEEIAVMIDTRRPLRVLSAADAVEVPDYWMSWQTKETR